MNNINPLPHNVDLDNAYLGPNFCKFFEKDNNNKTEKGLTNPTANGNIAELWNPISCDVNMDMVGLRVISCPAKWMAMASVM